ncbi:MAG: ABC transporter permease subunit [Ignavibacteriales bacterium]|nr:ABC transporter permease subunit [Ignavibacteriales bacterium]
MLKILLEKELRDIIYSTKFAITFAAAAVLVLLSFYVGIRNYQESIHEYESAKTTNAANIAAQTDWHQIQDRVFRKPQPLEILVNGVTNDVGRTTDMRSSGELNLINSRFSVDPLFAVFRFLDLNFVFVIVFSLFAILFGYDAINGEKEAGTLKLVFSNGVARASFILSKLLGSVLALGVPLLVPLLIGCLMLLGFGIPMSGFEWVRLGLVIVAGLLCFGVFLTLSIMVSAMVSRSSVSFLLALVVWIFSVLIIPKGSVLLASQIASVPSIDAVEIQKRKFTADQGQKWLQASQQWFSSRMSSSASVNDSGFVNAMAAFQDSLQKAREDARAEFYSRLDEDWRNKKDWQERWAFGISRVSPTAVFQIAAMNLAGTDVGMKFRYMQQLSRYRDAFAETIRKKTGSSADYFRIVIKRFSGGQNDQEEKQKSLNPSELPEYVEQPRSLGDVMTASMFDMGLLVVLNALFIGGAFYAFLRFDLR